MPVGRISVHHLTIADLGVCDFVRLAREQGVSDVSLFVNGLGHDFPLVDAANLSEVRQLLRDERVNVTSTADFVLVGTENDLGFASGVEPHRRYMDLSASLGAKYLNTVLGDTDEARAVDVLGRFAESAKQIGLNVAVEFLLMAPGSPNFQVTDRIVRKVDASNVTILLDVTHFTRSGGTVAQLQTADTSRVGYVHLADGILALPSDQFENEVVYDRLAPGDGQFPLLDILAALPRDVIYEIESPTKSLAAQGVPAIERLGRNLDGARSLLANLAAL